MFKKILFQPTAAIDELVERHQVTASMLILFFAIFFSSIYDLHSNDEIYSSLWVSLFWTILTSVISTLISYYLSGWLTYKMTGWLFHRSGSLEANRIALASSQLPMALFGSLVLIPLVKDQLSFLNDPTSYGYFAVILLAINIWVLILNLFMVSRVNQITKWQAFAVSILVFILVAAVLIAVVVFFGFIFFMIF